MGLGLHDGDELVDRLVDFGKGVVEGGRSESNHGGGAEVGNNAEGAEGGADLTSGGVRQRNVTAAFGRFAGCDDGESEGGELRLGPVEEMGGEGERALANG